MKNIFSLTLTAFLLTPFSVKAQNLLSQNSDITYFAQLIWKFKNEAQPITDLTEILGWTVGRCYYFEEPEKPLANLLIAQFSDDNGPMFRDIRFVVMPDKSQTTPPDRYDNLTKRDESEIASATKDVLPTLKTQKVHGEWVSSFTNIKNSIQVRKLNSYYIAVLKYEYDIDPKEHPTYHLKKGDIFASCYFFKKVK